MKKSFFSGMTMLLMGVAFVGCSSEVSVDPDYAHKKKVMEYDAAFEQAFGKIASGHEWGFDQFRAATRTRGAVTSTQSPIWSIPSDITYFKEGNGANSVREEFTRRYNLKNTENLGLKERLLNLGEVDFDFNNYWLRHAEKAFQHRDMGQLQAYDPATEKFEDVTNFSYGDNTAWYTINGKNAVHGGTLMVGMNNAVDPETGKMFRWGSENNWNYDYWFMYHTVQLKVDGKKQDVECLFMGMPRMTEKGLTWWVVLVAEAHEVENEAPKCRVFCEDMGSIGDFDFNDVVFDAEVLDNGDIKCTVLAAGGTLKITIDDQEVTMGKMVNTGLSEAEPQVITIGNVNGQPKYDDFNKIPVKVYPEGVEAQPYELEAPKGKAPQKICTYKGVKWPDEYVSIELAYSNFKTWVNDAKPADWIQNVTGDLVDYELSNNAPYLKRD